MSPERDDANVPVESNEQLEPIEPIQPISDDARMMETARRRYGAVGAMVAGGMLGLDRILGRRVKEDAPVVWETAGEPEDIDRGMIIDIDDETSVVSAPHRVRRRTIRRRRSAAGDVGDPTDPSSMGY